jgi:hypothetical protein
MNPELDELLEMLGAERAASLLRRFGAEIHAFEDPACSAAESKARAHRLISQAGMLGFHALSDAARNFEAVSGDRSLRQVVLGEARTALALAEVFAARCNLLIPARGRIDVGADPT